MSNTSFNRARNPEIISNTSSNRARNPEIMSNKTSDRPFFSTAAPSAKAFFSTAATAMVLGYFAKELIPEEFRYCLQDKIRAAFSSQTTVIIDEFDGLAKNELFSAAELYAATISSPSSRRYRASLPEKEKKIIGVSLGKNVEITDEFHNIQVKWRFLLTDKIPRRCVRYPGDYRGGSSSDRSLELTFHNKHKKKVIEEYLPHVLEKSEALKEDRKVLKLHSLRTDEIHGPGITTWEAVNLHHPANFDTLAMDDVMKKMIVDDLDTFLRRKEMYRRVGKAWKRGYFLHGPPGTGKTSLIAAMAYHLNFDIYDLELSAISSNSDLRHVLISTANKSILVLEDLEASMDLTERSKNDDIDLHNHPKPKVTLTGFLNMIEGLWSSVSPIIIFTTDDKEKLDPALLRRMDVQIHTSYCTPCGLNLLARNYLEIPEQHPFVLEAGKLVASSTVTPAEVAELLMKSEDPEAALRGLVGLIEAKKESGQCGKTKKIDEFEELMKKLKEMVRDVNAVHADDVKMIIGCLDDTRDVLDDTRDVLRGLVTSLEAKEESTAEVLNHGICSEPNYFL